VQRVRELGARVDTLKEYVRLRGHCHHIETIDPTPWSWRIRTGFLESSFKVPCFCYCVLQLPHFFFAQLREFLLICGSGIYGIHSHIGIFTETQHCTVTAFCAKKFKVGHTETTGSSHCSEVRTQYYSPPVGGGESASLQIVLQTENDKKSNNQVTSKYSDPEWRCSICQFVWMRDCAADVGFISLW
jgi:hypothetical protein